MEAGAEDERVEAPSAGGEEADETTAIIVTDAVGGGEDATAADDETAAAAAVEEGGGEGVQSPKLHGEVEVTDAEGGGEHAINAEDLAAAPKATASSNRMETPSLDGTSEDEEEPQTAASLKKIFVAERLSRVLAENVKLSRELTEANAEFEKLSSLKDRLDVACKAGEYGAERLKLVAKTATKNSEQVRRVELRELTEVAKQLYEMDDIHRRLQIVNRQLHFATDLQRQTLADQEHRLAARTRQIRRQEWALFSLVDQARNDPRVPSTAVTELVAKAGPLAQGVLAREAKRQELATALEGGEEKA